MHLDCYSYGCVLIVHLIDCKSMCVIHYVKYYLKNSIFLSPVLRHHLKAGAGRECYQVAFKLLKY